eukprot:TRINITY_DN20454_c0_g1::TRINITY_DN20454_c0_g1_i1::g.30::m.30 TRINITY_DN20454_c0_g1::TRINITY_DN20454_c0_g1_i1::g.30  ORF type:complete len:143 (+),score=2.14,Ank_2/PF12796.2/7.8e-10,Ank_2/PF12796.2/7.9e-05,Ank/PF00023.25/0.17,Ank/PF00023.25/0.046,Ank/PF00023.25/2.3e-05,Ank/PF00023.25/35,Ank_4/PF13637.1/0.0026,Ank_4/PF13637.1/1,Ank_5/PF13857.1/1.1e+02,Ank_5/PF13857.1/3,Ank_5/PF13857.1/0.0028,Ank_5/PF13857.1/1.9e+02,Ank_3/PF13606.1/1.4e+02,Ank_3/PF13606.1/4.9,Ank_3/PF13606.1/0.023,Ank_3/PF13606.1/6.
MIASLNGHSETVTALLQALEFDSRADKLWVLQHESLTGDTALLLTSSNGHVSTVTALLSLFENEPRRGGSNRVRALTHQNHDGNTALILASLNGHAPMVTHLLESLDAQARPTFIFQKNNGQETALTLAAKAGSHGCRESPA